MLDESDSLLWRPTHAVADAPLTLAEEEVNELDTLLQSMPECDLGYADTFRAFRACSRRVRRLPFACIVPSDSVQLLESYPRHQTALSDIWKGEWVDEWSGKITVVALKSLRIGSADWAGVEQSYFDELAIWRGLRHPNIVRFLGTCSTLPNCLLSEWMECGDIKSFLHDRKQDNRMPYIEQILRGLSYIHSLQLVHGDLKAANVLINSEQQACISDFGLTTWLHTTGVLANGSTVRGTLRWMAPELLAGEMNVTQTLLPSQASDMYAMALVMWEMFTGRVPFDHIPPTLEFRVYVEVPKGLRPLKPANAENVGFTEDVWNVMQKCWLATASKRLTCRQTLNELYMPCDASADSPRSTLASDGCVSDGEDSAQGVPASGEDSLLKTKQEAQTAAGGLGRTLVHRGLALLLLCSLLSFCLRFSSLDQ